MSLHVLGQQSAGQHGPNTTKRPGAGRTGRKRLARMDARRRLKPHPPARAARRDVRSLRAKFAFERSLAQTSGLWWNRSAGYATDPRPTKRIRPGFEHLGPAPMSQRAMERLLTSDMRPTVRKRTVGHPRFTDVNTSCRRERPGEAQPVVVASAMRLRVRFGSTGMPGPMVVVKVTFFRYRPLAAAGLARRISSRAAA